MAIGRTNKAKYDHYKAILDGQGQAFIDGFFPDGPPEAFYEVGRTEIKKYPVVGAYCAHGFYTDEKPSRDDVARIKFAAKLGFPFSAENVYLKYELREGKWKATGANRYVDIVNDERTSFDTDDLQEQLDANRAKYLLKPGEFSCRYCGKATPESAATWRTIISRSYTGLQKRFRYCSEECGLNDQMGHEG